jgi:hypothetical protein
MRNTYILAGKREHLGRPGHRWKINIKLTLKKQLAQDMDQWWALVNTVTNL